MVTYPQTITNPGAEAGNISGWTSSGSATWTTSTDTPYAGTYSFHCLSYGQTSQLTQTITLSGPSTTDIDAGKLVALFSCYFKSGGADFTISVECLDASDQVVFTQDSDTIKLGSFNTVSAWTNKAYSFAVYPGTRKLRFSYKIFGPSTHQIWVDETSITLDDTATANIKEYQAGAYSLGSRLASNARANQLGLLSLGASETSSGFHDVQAAQLGVYALVLSYPDRRDLCAWTFTQDDHDFYVLNVGGGKTLVYDMMSEQWSYWKSPKYSFWRGIDGTGWEGFNVACDPKSNKIWKIDPTGRLDYGTTPIESKIIGLTTERFRKMVPVYMAELAISEAAPPQGIDPTTVGISLRTVDGVESFEHGTVIGKNIGEDITARWFGLGLAKSPSRIFEITDTGYARRIDGFNIEVGNYEEERNG